MTQSPTVVGVLNSSEDTVEMLRMYLESEGFLVVSAHVQSIRRGEQTVGEAIMEHKPAVILIDIAPPYDRTWTFYKHLRSLEGLRDCGWVITSTNPDRLRELASESKDLDILEVIGKPHDLNQIVDAVKREVSRQGGRR